MFIPVVVAACVTSVVAASAPADAATSNSGTVVLKPKHGKSISLKGSMMDGIASVKFTVPSLKGAGVYQAVNLRQRSEDSVYRARVTIRTGGRMDVGFSKVVKGRERVMLSAPITGRVKAGQVLRLEGAIAGQSRVNLSVRAWRDGAPRPTWQQQMSDSSATRIKKAGKAGVWFYLSRHAKKKVSIKYRGLTRKVLSPAEAAKLTPAPGTKPGVPTTPRPEVPAGTKPSADTTGVPEGTALTRYDGDIIVTKAGTHLDGLDIHGFVTVRAPNVVITNSIVRGGVATNNTGLITNYGNSNLLIQDVYLKADHPSVWIDGIKGWEFTARRVHVVGNVDSIKIHGDNATVEDSLLEDTQYFATDPNQGGGPTHNDNIQIMGGKNIVVQGNTIRGSTNFAVLGSATLADLPNLRVEQNWVDGGHCTVKLSTLNGYTERATVVNNKFGPHRNVEYCPFQAEPLVDLSASGNVYEETGADVPILRKK